MSHTAYTAVAEAQMKLIADYLDRAKSATQSEISSDTGICIARTHVLMNSMRADGVVIPGEVGKWAGKGKIPVRWQLGCDAEYVKLAEQSGAPVHRVVKTWVRSIPAHHDLMAHFFGMAGAGVAS